jgi:hypothetical protein
MDQNTRRLYASVGVAGQVGCLMVVLAIGALVIGLWLDRTLNTRPIATLICVGLSVPLNLFIALRLTQLMVSRIIPQDKGFHSSQPAGDEDEP